MGNYSTEKPDILERVENRKFTRDTNLLFDILEHIGFDEPFTFDDFSRLRTISTKRGYRAYYGKENISRLVDGSLVENTGKFYLLTIKGLNRINKIEDMREAY